MTPVRRSAILATVLWACGGAQPGPFFDDARFLRFGVDPRAEAHAVIGQLKRAGLRVHHRQDAERHVAISFRSEDGTRSALRIITARGSALSLDSDADLLRRKQYDLITVDQLEGVAAFPSERVFVRVAGEHTLSCVAAFEVQSDGAIRRLVIDAGAVEVDNCASEVTDVDGDGRVELVVQATFGALALDPPPMLRVPLTDHDGGYRLVAGVAPMAMLMSQQSQQTEVELRQARALRDVERAQRAGIELAAIARFRGETRNQQLQTFDTAMRGLVLTGRQAAQLEAVRALIREDWALAADAPEQAAPATDEVSDAAPTPQAAPSEATADAEAHVEPTTSEAPPAQPAAPAGAP